MRCVYLILAAIPLLVSAAIADGLWTNRWGSSHALEEAVDRLANVPMDVGRPETGVWHGHPKELDEEQIKGARLSGHLLRTYVQEGTGDVVEVLLVCGRPGPIAVHTPDVCYQGAGYNVEGAPALVSVPFRGKENKEDSARFMVGHFVKDDPAQPNPLRIWWGWTAAGSWDAADDPRLHYAWYPALYKMYIIHPMSSLNETEAEDPSPVFLKEFLPIVENVLFPRS
jgi:hypothetical protein